MGLPPDQDFGKLLSLHIKPDNDEERISHSVQVTSNVKVNNEHGDLTIDDSLTRMLSIQELRKLKEDVEDRFSESSSELSEELFRDVEVFSDIDDEKVMNLDFDDAVNDDMNELIT